MPRSRVRPLLVHPETRRECFGDGVCCTDFHLLGPIPKGETLALQAAEGEDVAELWLGQGFIAVDEDTGACPLLVDGLCGIHEAPHKPSVCGRFPLTLVATPRGGRVSVEHRCTCPNHGEAPRLDAASLEHDLQVGRRLRCNHRLTEVRLRGDETVSFEVYRERERSVLDALEREGPSALGAPFPPLRDATWSEVGRAFREQPGDARVHEALRWVGDAILRRDGVRAGRRKRPWADGIERAAARSDDTPLEARRRRWIVDSLWGLCWSAYCSFAQAQAELATRSALLDILTRRLRRVSPLPFVEALMLIDFVGTSEWWEDVAKRMEG